MESQENKNDYIKGKSLLAKEDYSNLTPEEIKILTEINDIMVLKNIDLFVPRVEKIKLFIKELQEKGIKPDEYLLGYRMVGGLPSQDEEVKFDTLNHEIEYFIRSLKE